MRVTLLKNVFFPIEYIRQVLALNIPYDVKEETPIEEIIAFYDSKNVNYLQIWKESYDRYANSHRTLANWLPEDFDNFVIGDKLYTLKDSVATPVEGNYDIKAIFNNDKTILQNYCRPYEGGKLTGCYYPFAKTEPLPEPFKG